MCGMAVRRGRPKKPKATRKDVIVPVRVTPSEKDEIAEGATRAGAGGASAWMRMLALQEARKLKRDEGGPA
jgi:hypothetical protein